ncbi:hypothetical protein V4E86_21490 [Burkholderia pseudomallei]|uniref:Uncharacterized protein n=1 Tax=Burkholderia pseudomallei 1710a TaxID=320371 RepID=A0A0E1VX47_BURPE|nr:hypothetical protein [Burkholderia pseudomallei]AYE30429.1 hypothetical protein CNX72_24120 [Burkholderia pseudomallei]EET05473.1 hypothetical protein BURPS1710A_A2840 [Burkholderia pseudomallei 1710a]MCQ8222298.1 hypothetical protein [Burkholderia pseudomallei]MCW0097409.1 hypothetical protein [Burkholderia pseudomallei]MDV2102981.1 hypothetical protein [Burkholderia pseudomallei]
MNGRLRRRLAGRAPGRTARLRVAPRACAIVRTPERTATRARLACLARLARLACAAYAAYAAREACRFARRAATVAAARAPQAGRRAYASSAPPLPFDFTR